MSKSKQPDTRPAASFDASYNTYEDMKYKPLDPHTVTLKVEEFIRVEVGGWGTNIRIIVDPGSQVSSRATENGFVIVTCVPPKKRRTSLFTQEQLNKKVEEIVK